MKRVLSIVLALAVLATMCLAFASCGVSGTYEGVAADITFDGKNITFEKAGQKAEGTYKIKDDKITIDIEDTSIWGGGFKLFEGEHDFEKGKDYIKIDGFTYTKKK